MARRKEERSERRYYYRERPNREKYFYLGVLAAIILLIIAVASGNSLVGIENPEPEIENNTTDEKVVTTIVGSSESYMSGSDWTTYDRYKYDNDRSPPPNSSPPPEPPQQRKYDHQDCRNHECREYREKQYKNDRPDCGKYYRGDDCGEGYYHDTKHEPCLDRCGKEQYLTRNREVLGWGEKIYLRALHNNRERPAVVEKERRESETNDCDWWDTGYRRLAEAGWHGSDEFECWR